MSDPAARELVDLAQAYRHAFETPAGQRVLADLKACYDGSAIGRSARETEIRAAQRDVLIRIEELIRIGGVEGQRAADEMSRRLPEVAVMLQPWRAYAVD